MAIGPLARIVAQIIVPVVAILARALPAAYSQALQNARKAGMNSEQAASAMLRRTLTKEEALQILNVTEKEASPQQIQNALCRFLQLRSIVQCLHHRLQVMLRWGV